MTRPTPAVHVAVREHLDDDEVAAVLALLDAVTESDGERPLSEHVMLHLRSGGDEHDQHLLARHGDGGLVGYLHLDATDPVAGASAEVAVHPDARRRGVGTALVDAAMSSYGGRHFRLWAHGGNHGAHGLAQSLGFGPARTLWQMRRSLYAPLPHAPLPSGLVVRSFRHPQDDDKVLRVNNRAFVEHPEQGQWTSDDLHARLAEDWFDPTGFLLAVSADHPEQVAGFHWTKVHGGMRHAHGDGPDHTHPAMGEVYVLGVDPDWRGTGLGRGLTVAGLAYLRSLGLDQAMLYVDADNAPAIALYESLGFTHWDSDVMYRRSR